MDFKEKDLWLKSDWYFKPEAWGCIAFTHEWAFNKVANAGTIIAIYAIKDKAVEKKIQGKFLGFVELSDKTGDTRDFVSPKLWQEHKKDIEAGKWRYAVGIKRAWKIIDEDIKNVKDVFPNTYDGQSRNIMGLCGKEVDEADFINIEKLRVREVAVYPQSSPPVKSETTEIVEALVKSSRAGPINKGGYFIDDMDGARHLYILQLEGSLKEWLGEYPAFDYENKIIIKVGFSKNPRVRCRNIQSNYPSGQFKWRVVFPKQFHNPPASDGATAKIGEEVMKEFLENHPKANSLGGEFYLVPKFLCKKCFEAGLDAINGLA